MESMEVLDLEELKENKNEVLAENLKEFMSKDEEVSKLLENKINEINSETEKLNSKEKEIKKLEESNREKISMDASPEELIEIAEKIKSAQTDLSEINTNIEKLKNEKNELEKTKESVEISKKEYIKNLSKASSDYQNKISKIEEAIAVCDNPSLKQVLEDVIIEKETTLTSLQKDRNNELKIALNPIEEINEEKNIDNIDDDNFINNIEIPIFDESTSNSVVENDLTLNEKIKPELDIPVINQEIINENNEENKLDDNMIGLDSILSNNITLENENIVMPKLNNIETDSIVIPQKVEEKVKIIFSKDVPSSAIKEILSSSTVMPNVYSYLENNIISQGGILL